MKKKTNDNKGDQGDIEGEQNHIYVQYIRMCIITMDKHRVRIMRNKKKVVEATGTSQHTASKQHRNCCYASTSMQWYYPFKYYVIGPLFGRPLSNKAQQSAKQHTE